MCVMRTFSYFQKRHVSFCLCGGVPFHFGSLPTKTSLPACNRNFITTP